MLSHARQLHGLRADEYRAKYGDPEPVAAAGPDTLFEDGEGHPPIGSPETVCPECGKVYSHALGHNRPAQALGMHLARAHGIRSTATRGKEPKVDVG